MRKHFQFIHHKNDGHSSITQCHIDPLSLDRGRLFYKNASIIFEDPMKVDILSISELYYNIFGNLFLSLKVSNLNPARKFEAMYDLEVECSNSENS